MILGTDESDYLRVRPPHPGGMFKDGVLDAVDGYPGMTLNEAAAKLGVSRVTLSRIVNGHDPISINMALKMEALGWGTADGWLKQQLDYDLAQARKRLNQPLAKSPAVLRAKRMPAETESDATKAA